MALCRNIRILSGNIGKKCHLLNSPPTNIIHKCKKIKNTVNSHEINIINISKNGMQSLPSAGGTACRYLYVWKPPPCYSSSSTTILSSAYFSAMLISSFLERFVRADNLLYSSCIFFSVRIVIVTYLSSLGLMISLLSVLSIMYSPV